MKTRNTPTADNSHGSIIGQPKRTKEHKVKREVILKRAADLFARHGYKATTMDMLSAHTGLNKATLYYYYSSKKLLLFDICLFVLDQTFNNATHACHARTAGEGFKYFIDSAFQIIDMNWNEAKVFNQEISFWNDHFEPDQLQDLKNMQRQLLSLVYSILQRGVDSGEFAIMDTNIAVRLVLGALNYPFLFGGEKPKIGEVTTTTCNILLHGLCSRA